MLPTCHNRNDRQHDPGIGQGLPGDGPGIITLLVKRGVD